MKRTPEPELMDAPEQAAAYARADFDKPNSLFVKRLMRVLDPERGQSLIDLGCGPGDICLRIARKLPHWHITGLDAGPNMLALAREATAAADLDGRIDLVEARLPEHGLENRFDAVVSNSLIHHLPDPTILWQSITDLAADGAIIQVMDLNRPESEQAAQTLVEENAAGEPEILRQDFYNSLCAAWTDSEVAEQLRSAGLDQLHILRPTAYHWLVQGRFVHS